MSDANRSSLNYKVETTFGVALTPPISATQTLRFTKCSINQKNGVVLSNEIVANRVRSDQLLVSYAVDGSIGGEMSYGTYDDFIEAGLGGTWTANVLTQGVVVRSFYFEEGYADVAQFFRHLGVTVDTIDLDITSKQIIGIDIGVKGAQSIIHATTDLTAPVAITSSVAMTAQANVANILFAGSGLTAKAKSLKLNIKNNLRERDYIGALTTDVFGRGFVEVSGSLDVYFTDASIYTPFYNNTKVAISFDIGGVSTAKYHIVLPNCKLSGSTVDATGGNTDVMQPCTFNCFFDTTAGYLIQITRTP